MFKPLPGFIVEPVKVKYEKLTGKCASCGQMVTRKTVRAMAEFTRCPQCKEFFQFRELPKAKEKEKEKEKED